MSAAAAAAVRGHGPANHEIVRAIDRATLDALAGAIIEVFPGLPRPPVLAHLAGGDDLMVSVPAAYAWPFTRSLVAGFGSRVASAADRPAGHRKPQVALPVIVMNNGQYAILKAFRDRLGLAENIPGLDLPGIDLVGIATGFGCTAECLTDSDQLRVGLTRAMRASGPYLLDVQVDPAVAPLSGV